MRSFCTLLIFLVTLVSSCQSQTAGGNVDPKTFSSQIQSTPEAVILDVRTAEEYADGYIKGAINLDIYEPDFKDKVTKMDRSKTYFVYCHAGGRGEDAVAIMKKEGFNKVVNLDGGIVAWRKSKFPIEID